MFASSTAGFLANFSRIHFSVGVERALVEPVHQAEAKKFLQRSASRGCELALAATGFAIEHVDRNPEQAIALERAVFERVDLVAGLVQVAACRSASELTIRMPPGSRSLRLVLRAAAGFMATSVSSSSPGV